LTHVKTMWSARGISALALMVLAVPAVAQAPAAKPAAKPAAAAGENFASYTGNAANGKKVYAQCMACHSQTPGQNKVGPSLHNIVGRKAGQVPGFKYSEANLKSGLVWSEKQLFTYLKNPRATIPGTKMAFAGIADAQKRADVIAYLKVNGKI